MRRSTLLLASAAAVLVALSGTAGAPPDPPTRTISRAPAARLSPTRSPDGHSLKAVNDCGALFDYVTEVVVEALVRQLYWWQVVPLGGGPVRETDSSSAITDYTTTNVQEQGVDELDLVKTDGQYLYVTQDDLFAVARSWPPERSHLSATLPLEGFARGLFVRRDLAAVFSDFWDGVGFAPRHWGGTRIRLIDVSDRSAPRVVRTLDLEGALVDARLIDGQLYAVISTWMPIPEAAWRLLERDDLGLPELDWDATEEERAAAAALARRILKPLVGEIVAGLALDELVPLYRDQKPEDGDRKPAPLLGCGDLYRPASLSDDSVLSILHLDLDGPSPADAELHATGLLANGWTVYASARSLYVAQSGWWWWGGWGAPDETTAIHKFSLAGDSERPVRYAASGTVDGWLVDQFAMGEHADHLRVATTASDWWRGGSAEEAESGSMITVLRDNRRGALERVGLLEGIAPGDRIYGCRFLGDRGYLVTFRQVDPLFTLDLSVPSRPRIVGELKVPGYSSYLHPIGEDHLLTVGIDADDQGRPLGLAVSVFDVTDFGHPRLAHRFLVEDRDDTWSWSEALEDHHAFTYHRGVLSIPASLSGSEGSVSGLVVLHADPVVGIEELGRVDHGDLPEGPWGSAWMRRSVYIEDALYSLSSLGIKVNELYRPAVELARVPFYDLDGAP
jgi:uncharacterized secreted protein with C-terminal beta-propeller domain